MDLPTCPHCGESVLEDDVDDCPFCGESMSGKPTAKTSKTPVQAAAPKTKPAPAETKSQTQKPATKKPAPAKKSASANPDEPFAVDQAAMSNAVPLRPKPSKGRAFKVVCPMCETAGYTSPKAAGRDVKCANPKCLVPVFTCPEPPPAPVEEEPESAGLSTTQLGLMSVAALAVIGAGIWFFVLKKDNAAPPSLPRNEVGQNDDPIKTPETPQDGKAPKTGTPQTAKGPDLVKLRRQAAETMIETSELPSERSIQRPKPLRVQWTALALADLGELEKAEAQLDRLASLNDDSPHYRVLPWVEIGWKRREREEDAGEAASKALEFSKDLPSSKRETWLEAVSLSGLLAALDRADESLPLLSRNLGEIEDQELWADQMAVMLDHSFNLEAMERVRPVVTPIDPTWSGVVWQLVFHDAADRGLKWAERATDARVRSEALIAWADAAQARALAMKEPADFAPLDAAIEKLPDPWKSIALARAYARLGERYAVAENQEMAKPLLERAKSALAALPQKSAMELPDLKAIYAGDFPGSPANSQMAAAAFEAARLQVSLGQKDEAWKSIEQGLQVLRSESLPLKDATDLVADAKASPDFLRAQLRSALSLDSDDEARRAFRDYQKHVNDLKEAADARLKRQADLLTQAARWGLSERVYQEITEAPEGRTKDSYFQADLDLPWVVYAELKAAGSDKVGGLVSLIRENKLSKPKGLALKDETADWIASTSDIPKLILRVQPRVKDLPDAERRRWTLRLASRQVLQGKTEVMLSFLLALYKVDPFLGEEAAELIVALATSKGQGDLIRRELEQRGFSPTQKIAAYRGLIAAATPLVPPPAPEPATE